MAVVMIKCSQTGRDVSTGIETDAETFERLPDLSTQLQCPKVRPDARVAQGRGISGRCATRTDWFEEGVMSVSIDTDNAAVATYVRTTFAGGAAAYPAAHGWSLNSVKRSVR